MTEPQLFRPTQNRLFEEATAVGLTSRCPLGSPGAFAEQLALRPKNQISMSGARASGFSQSCPGDSKVHPKQGTDDLDS